MPWVAVKSGGPGSLPAQGDGCIPGQRGSGVASGSEVGVAWRRGGAFPENVQATASAEKTLQTEIAENARPTWALQNKR